MHASLGFCLICFNGPKAYELECRRKYEQRMARKAARLQQPLAEVMKGSQVPGGSLHFNNEPSWLTEKGDMTEEMGPETKSDGKKQKKVGDKKGCKERDRESAEDGGGARGSYNTHGKSLYNILYIGVVSRTVCDMACYYYVRQSGCTRSIIGIVVSW